MSTNLALAGRLAPTPTASPAEERRRSLVEVTSTRAQRRARPRIVTALVAVGALGVLLLAQLAISIVLSKGAYELSSLQATQTSLARTQQGLDEKLSVLRSPQNLARNAQALGMVANSTPVYLDPVTGTVYGTPTAAAPSGTTADANQVANALLNGVGVVTKQGDTATSKEQQKSGATAPATTGTAGSAVAGSTADSGAASASDGGSADGSVPSDPNQLQAPQTR